jgi:hypothetical protein|tara:strand:- start:373 stop:1356 length:984 start_codon:yes stop_codon:yes gene_type:complete
MPKVSKGGQRHVPQLLDTLAQPWKTGESNLLKAPLLKAYTTNQSTLQKRARTKAISNAVVFKLTPLQSPLNKAYWSTFHCSNSILQDGDKLTSRYCNQRWCLVCNRIRTAKLMRGYLPSIDVMKDPQFVTLTRPNVKGGYLRSTFSSMQSTFIQCKDNLRKQGITLVGIRKVETTYNVNRDDFHPHFHFIIDGKKESEALKTEWLKRNPKALHYLQNVKPCTDPIELFKYFTKLLTKDGQFLAEPMDKAFRAMKGKRVFQPFGGIKKQSEEVDVNESSQCDWKDYQTEIWTFESSGKFSDWYNANGEALSEVELTKDTMRLIEKITA